jgi:prevent-host-death family protein
MTGCLTGHYMETYAASEAKTHFLRILDNVEQGQSVIITRHGKPVARITPEVEVDREKVRQAFQRMHALRERVGKLPLSDILSARDEGRE